MASQRVLGLRIVFKDLSIDPDIPESLREHSDPACSTVKKQHLNECHQHCSVDCARALSTQGQAHIRGCPFGHSELVCAIEKDDTFLGWISAGPLWLGKGKAPRRGLLKPRNQEWVQDRLVMLAACAQQLSALLDYADSGRHAQLMAYIHKHLHREITLADIAELFDISSSRCGHLIKELCGLTFPQLLRQRRCHRAARLLLAEEGSVAAIGKRVGIPDPSWFCESFRQVYGATPDQWRKRMQQIV